MRTRGKVGWIAGLVLVVVMFVVAFAGESVASASKLTLTSKLKPYSTSQSRCSGQAVAVTTPVTSGATNQLLVTNLDTAKCLGKSVTVTVYDPAVSTWAAAQRATSTANLSTAAQTFTATGTFLPNATLKAYVTIGGWPVAATFTSVVSRLVQLTDRNGKCLDVQSRNFANGTHVQIYTCNQTPAQKWSLMANGQLRAGDYCLQVPNSTTTNGTMLTIAACTTNNNMLWNTTTAWSTAPYVEIVSRLSWTPDVASGGCLDVPGGATADSTQVQIYTCGNQNQNQYWRFTDWTWADAP